MKTLQHYIVGTIMTLVVLQAPKMGSLLPDVTKFLQKHIQINRLIDWLVILFLNSPFVVHLCS